MIGPRVEELQYEVVALAENDSVEAIAEESKFELSGFRCRVAGQMLTAEPIADFSGVEDARASLEPHLRDWEAELDLETLPIGFRFSSAKVSRPQPDVHTAVMAMDAAVVSERAHVHKQIPMTGPTGRIKDTPVVMLIRNRWLSRTRRTIEPIPAAAYALVTFVIDHFGGGDEARAADRLGVSRKLLEAVRRISSKSDPVRGRKVTSRRETLSDEEVAWLERAVNAIGIRAAEVDSGGVPEPQVTLETLPPP